MAIARIALLAAWLAAGLWAGPAPATAQEIYAARVNGAGITLKAVEAGFDEILKDKGMHLLQVRDPAKVKQMKHQALDSLIDDELLWQAARKNNAVADDRAVDEAFALAAQAFKGEDRLRLRLAQEEIDEADYRERIRRKLSGQRYAEAYAAKKVKVSDKEIRAFYKANPDKFHRPETIRVRQILIRVAPDATEAQRAEARAKVEGILAEARSGKDFGELARQHSEDATKQWDGELDPMTRGGGVPAFEAAAFALEPGGISEVVSTSFGFHVIKMEQRFPEVTISEKDARERIRTYIETTRREEAVKALLVELRAKATIDMLLPL